MSNWQRLPNGSIDAHDDSGRVSELQEILDRTNKELSQSREASATLGIRIAELEAELTNARRELSRSEELSIKQQREQREVSPVTSAPMMSPTSGLSSTQHCCQQLSIEIQLNTSSFMLISERMTAANL